MHMGPNARGNFSALHGGGSSQRFAEKNEISNLPTAAIICLGISGYILLMAIALVVRRCIKTNETSKFADYCCTFESPCQNLKCSSSKCFPSGCNFIPECAGICSSCKSNCENLKSRCMIFSACVNYSSCNFKSLFPFCGSGTPLCECGTCKCVCACQLPQCESINCCCFEIRIRP